VVGTRTTERNSRNTEERATTDPHPMVLRGTGTLSNPSP
jgi:hypothetical protein